MIHLWYSIFTKITINFSNCIQIVFNFEKGCQLQAGSEVTQITKQPMRNIQVPRQIQTTKLIQWHSNLAWDSEFLNGPLKIYFQAVATFKRTQVWTAINHFSIKAHQYIKQRTFTIHIQRYINIINFNYSNSVMYLFLW